jgi:YVTN family beta-propeller protein
MNDSLRLIPWLAAGLLALPVLPVRAADGPYHLLKEIKVGGTGSWDYLAVDPAAHRLYVSHGTTVVVIDTATDTVVGEIGDTQGVHGIAIAPDLKRAFVSDGRENKVSIVDTVTLATLSKVEAGKNPDAIVFDPGQAEVYAFNGRSNSATVIAAATGQVVATIPLPGKPEFAACDPVAGRVYNNLEDKSQVAVIDTKTHQVVAIWPIAPGESASGMAFDPANHRLFLGCDNHLMVMMDTTNGQVVATVPIGEGVDANAFDPGTGYAFSSNGEGNVTVAHEDSPGQLTVVQTLTTAPRARTMMVDPGTHKIYLSSADFVAPAANAPAAAGARARPQAVPGSFKVLVYGMN